MDRYRHVFAVITGMLIGMAVPVFCAWFLSRMHPEISMSDHAFTIMMVSLVFGGVGVAVNLPSSSATGESAYYSAMGSDGSRRRRSGTTQRKAERAAPVSPPPHEEVRREKVGPAGGERQREDASADGGAGAGASAGAGAGAGAGAHIPHRAGTVVLGRREALHILGLELTATNEQIRAAFRKLAKEHHPDQFAHAGDEAVTEATKTFRRIHEAYKSLMG